MITLSGMPILIDADGYFRQSAEKNEYSVARFRRMAAAGIATNLRGEA